MYIHAKIIREAMRNKTVKFNILIDLGVFLFAINNLKSIRDFISSLVMLE